MVEEIPHTELVWTGKRKEVDRVSLPFQVIETVNESKTDRDNRQMELLSGKKPTGKWRNKLIWGDNKLVMASLLKEFAGKIDLIYIDPPFATGADFSYKINVGEETVVKEPSIIEELAYRDTWGKGTNSYLQMIYSRVIIMKDLLSEKGSLYIHLDEKIGHYVKVIMDEIFGKNNFQREITWNTASLNVAGFKGEANNWIYGSGSILYYTKTREFIFNKQHVARSKEFIARNYKDRDSKGLYRITRRGNKLYLKDDKGDAVTNVWNDILSFNYVAIASRESVFYPTQKPEALLERIIKASSDQNSIIVDFFSGSGTTGAVAEKLGRRWIMCDLGRFAIHTTRKRLLQLEGCRPFEIRNLGKYERQYWYTTISSGKTKEQSIIEYIRFILNLYKAEPISGFQHLHGRKTGRVVHVGAVDAPVTLVEVEEVIDECKKAKQDKIDILGWEFEMGIDAEVEKQAKAKGVKLRLLKIPREVMEKRTSELGQVEFYDLAALRVGINTNKQDVTVEIKHFYIPHLDLVKEEEVRQKIKRWEDYIDYWAVDWDFKEDTFHNQWQDFRTRKDPSLKLKAKYTYGKQGRYKIMVKVMDVFGNDTTKVEEVTIK